ncbi:MAG: hypothetical protein IPK76_07605 [Lewinellaceae bacterium]|jgi:hypothetical protein|nr:hypothetical protein [Lewinellaceae bacterium]
MAQLQPIRFLVPVLVILTFFSTTAAQTDSPDTLIARLGYYQCIVTARAFDGDSVINSVRHVQVIGPNGRTESYTSYGKNGEMRGKLTFEYDTLRHIEIENNYDKGGRLEYRHENTFGPNFFQRTQTRVEDGDLVSSGKWVKDSRGRDSLFYRFGKLYTRYRYNAAGDLVEKKTYAPNGQLDGTWHYVVKHRGNITETYESDNGTLTLLNKQMETPERTVVYELKKSTGYLYGIELKASPGGKRTTYRNADGLVTAKVYTNSKGKVYARIDFEYVRTP